jgi:hypothetical protein
MALHEGYDLHVADRSASTTPFVASLSSFGHHLRCSEESLFMTKSRLTAALTGAIILCGAGYAATANADLLRPGQSLSVGQKFYTDGRSCFLTLNSDGNMTIFRNNVLLWQSGTQGSGAVTANMQHDGNFVLYTADGRPVWSTRTQGTNRVFGIEYTGLPVIIMPGKRFKPDRYANARTIPELRSAGGRYQWRGYIHGYPC